MTGSNGQSEPAIDKRDFDTNRPLRRSFESGTDAEEQQQQQLLLRGVTPRSWSEPRRSGESSDGLLTDVVEELVERDRRKIARKFVRVCSFVWGIVSCLGAGSITAFSLYGPLLLTRLHYTQLQVNGVSIAAEISMYLPVPFFGFLCDRYSPAPLSLIAAVLFGGGYLLAAFAYKHGPPPDAGGTGWPYWVMVVAFIAVGTATSSMYLGAIATCAKNFGRGKHKGIMLAMPIAAFGLSGMWQSQVGTYLLVERLADGSRGEVDVFRYFLFLSILLFSIGIIGIFALRIVHEEEERYIEEAVEELERSGLLEESEFFQTRHESRAAYGTFDEAEDANEQTPVLSEQERDARRREKEREEEERRKKNWLLNYETRLFLKDQTMWWLALGFFLVTGPGEAYINNLGTIIQTLTPPGYPSKATPPAGLASTHVTIVALTSTIARLLTGSLSDYFAPTATHLFPGNTESAPFPALPRESHQRPTVSRLAFLLPSALLLSLGYFLLSSPLPLSHPSLSHVTTAFVGFGYGSAFSLIPIIISVVWGVENFGTNWGIVAMVPALGAAVWGLVYSSGYQNAIRNGAPDGQCHGWRCYGFWAIGCTVSVWVAVVAWVVAWRCWRRRGVVV